MICDPVVISPVHTRDVKAKWVTMWLYSLDRRRTGWGAALSSSQTKSLYAKPASFTPSHPPGWLWSDI